MFELKGGPSGLGPVVFHLEANCSGITITQWLDHTSERGLMMGLNFQYLPHLRKMFLDAEAHVAQVRRECGLDY